MVTKTSIKKVLIANRGEIACRVIRTLKRLDIDSVAVYSDADRHAQHVQLADQAVHLGPAPVSDSYLKADAIIAAAKQTGADAIHPGYGFLSENAAFAKQCAAEGLIFIGPPADAIDAMGSKAAAKNTMAEAQVPLIPGYHGADQTPQTLLKEAQRIGFPVLLKAALGGGGKGMRLVEQEADFAAALDSCCREARTAFGDDHMLIEKYIGEPRHVEIQVFCDQHGQGVYLFERDCSLQRRHQKVVEEAPAPGLTPAIREAMGAAAVRAAQAIGYQGAGTIEFLLDQQSHFYFMEMNTRLQVEHPVTEMITGLDLVEWQVRVAQGDPLPMAQDALSINGHALEVRIYAENPDLGFLPATGRLDFLEEPACSQHVRIDTGVIQGDEITPFYDPMIAKLIVWDRSREHALHRLQKALTQYRIGGVVTNIPFLHRLVTHPGFVNAELSTHFIATHEAGLLPGPVTATPFIYSCAALFRFLSCSQPDNVWTQLNGWRLNAADCQQFHFQGDETLPITVTVTRQGALFSVTCQGEQLVAQAERHGNRLLLQQASSRTITLHQQGNRMTVFYDGQVFPLLCYAPDFEHGTDAGHGLRAPMNGRIVSVLVTAGQAIAAGDALVIMEAMKMEHTIKAAHAGTVSEVFYAVGDLVNEGVELLQLDEEPAHD